MAASRKPLQEHLARDLQMDHAGPRKPKIGQHRIEKRRLLHRAGKTVKNHAARRLTGSRCITAQPRTDNGAHQIIIHQRARSQYLSQSETSGRIPPRFGTKYLSCRKNRHAESRRERRTLRALATARSSQEKEHAWREMRSIGSRRVHDLSTTETAAALNAYR